IFTAKDDDTVGDVIDGSSGSPTNYYADRALEINCDTNAAVQYVRVSYASTGIRYQGGVAIMPGDYGNQFSVSNVQISHCGIGIWTGNTDVTDGMDLHNGLIVDTETALSGAWWSGWNEYLTVVNCNRLVDDTSAHDYTVDFHHCVLANVTNV